MAVGLAVATGATAVPAATAVEPAPAASHAATQAAIDTLKTSHGAPGSGAVVRDGDAMWSVSSGTRAINQNLPFGPDHKVKVGSLTKTFTAAVVMQLVAEQKVDLNASVETYLPGVVRGNGYDGNAVSVRQLLNHTSGIYDYLEAKQANLWDFMVVQQNRTHTLAELASWGLAKPPYFAPGAGYHYSGTNYMLLGMIIEKVTGNPYGQEVNSRIVTPLGLTNTYLPAPGDPTLPPGHVRGNLDLGLIWIDVTDRVEPSIGLSGGGLVTSGADATRFFQALMSGQVVPPAQLAEMITPTNAPGSSAPDYGLGLDKFTLPCGGEAWGHYGIWPGYQTIAAATKDGRAAFVEVNNLGVNDLDAMAGSGSGGGVNRSVTLVEALCDKS
ncbi:serine hydrolase domain-containing protein [Streptomyces sp. NPDC006544]|uniref:serine hydrolase domain-containing protein n=1 Tax=Streptomyces sp. NPDC006544 TaxID=3154583 RepID=UPI0033B99DE7